MKGEDHRAASRRPVSAGVSAGQVCGLTIRRSPWTLGLSASAQQPRAGSAARPWPLGSAEAPGGGQRLSPNRLGLGRSRQRLASSSGRAGSGGRLARAARTRHRVRDGPRRGGARRGVRKRAELGSVVPGEPRAEAAARDARGGRALRTGGRADPLLQALPGAGGSRAPPGPGLPGGTQPRAGRTCCRSRTPPPRRRRAARTRVWPAERESARPSPETDRGQGQGHGAPRRRPLGAASAASARRRPPLSLLPARPRRGPRRLRPLRPEPRRPRSGTESHAGSRARAAWRAPSPLAPWRLSAHFTANKVVAPLLSLFS